MSKQTTTKNRRFNELVKAGEVKHIPLVHETQKPPFWLTIKEIGDAYGDRMSYKTMKLYSATGRFPHPVALMLTSRAPAWLYSAREIAEFFENRKTRPEFDKAAYDKMVARSKKLQAKGARMRYRADKMAKRFLIETSEVK